MDGHIPLPPLVPCQMQGKAFHGKRRAPHFGGVVEIDTKYGLKLQLGAHHSQYCPILIRPWYKMSPPLTRKDDSTKPTMGLSLMPSTSIVSEMGQLAHGSKAGSNVLPPGTSLGEFEITDLIGEGGFGIVYLAHDHILQRNVAIKEYMPASLATRAEDGATIHPTSDRTSEAFQKGLFSFINEARLLARFDHPSMVKVFRFWEGNGTAYMAMPFYDGPSLRQILQEQHSPPDEAWLMKIICPLLDALEILHEAQCFHRDIAPDNIIISANSQPVLLDFGAARRVLSESSQSLTVILKPGYAPIEQYADVAQMRQGAWTDLYALASVVHCAIHGKPPPTSVTRMIADPLQPLATSAAGRYSTQFLLAFDAALSVLPDKRPQSVTAMRVLLGIPPRSAAATRSSDPRHGGPCMTADVERTVQLDSVSRTASIHAAPFAQSISATSPTEKVTPAQAVAPNQATAASPHAARGRPRSLIVTALIILALIASAIAVYLTNSTNRIPPSTQPVPIPDRPAPAQAPTPAQTPVPAPAPEAERAIQPHPTVPPLPKEPPAEAVIQKNDLTRPASNSKPSGRSLEQSPEKPSAKTAPGDRPPVTARPSAVDTHKPSSRPYNASLDEKASVQEVDRGPKPQTPRKSSRCSDLLHRITLGETLTPEDENVMKRECR